MQRFVKNLTALTLGLIVAGVANAGGPGGHSSGSRASHSSGSPASYGSGSSSSQHSSHYGNNFGSKSFQQSYFSKHFDYGKYGKSSLYWSHCHWCRDWSCYFYYCPTACCWYFWVPTTCVYVPVEYIAAVQTPASVVTPAVNVVQTVAATAATAPAPQPPLPAVPLPPGPPRN